MDRFHVYKELEQRTGGEIYLGVVGPVRTGKSTFIKRFMELLVLPNIEDDHLASQARDELPQSAAGKTIMTTEPKFIPKNAVNLKLEDGISAKVRLIDCVGFMIPDASGHYEDGSERLVKTPWFEEEIPFTKAAETGTRKVICDHSTIGILVTTDGSFGEISRENYLKAEERTVMELRKIGKPFVILLNTVKPHAEETKTLAAAMETLYSATVVPVNCEQLKKRDIEKILSSVLQEFPVSEIGFSIPGWMEIFPDEYPMKQKVIETAKEILKKCILMKDMKTAISSGSDPDDPSFELQDMDLSNGKIRISVKTPEEDYYQVLKEYTGLPIEDEYSLFHTLAEYSSLKGEYEKVKDALHDVRSRGYGIMLPDQKDIILEEPVLIRHGNKFGVRIHAKAPSVNLIRAEIETEIAPIVGSEEQAEDLIGYLKKNSSSEEGVWNTSIFGKSVEQIVEDGMRAKISQMTEDCQTKLQDTLQKIINDSNGGMICIII